MKEDLEYWPLTKAQLRMLESGLGGVISERGLSVAQDRCLDALHARQLVSCDPSGIHGSFVLTRRGMAALNFARDSLRLSGRRR